MDGNPVLMNTIKVKQDDTNKWPDCPNEDITTVIMSDFYCLNFELLFWECAIIGQNYWAKFLLSLTDL